jgi:hypothetical protein
LGLQVLARTNPDGELLTGVVQPFFVLLRTQLKRLSEARRGAGRLVI